MRASLLTALLWFASAVIVFAMLLRMLPNGLDGKRYVPLIVAIMPSVHPFSPRPSNQGLWNKSLDSIAQLQHYDNDLNNVHVENGTIEISGLEASQRPLQIADDTIDKATREVKTVKAVKTPHVAQIADALKTAETYCEKLDSMVHSLNSIVQVLPSMLGTESHANDAPRNYLILAQTNAEARPSGGLTGSLGLVTVQGGHVSLQPFVSDSEIQNADEPVVDLTAEERLLFMRM